VDRGKVTSVRGSFPLFFSGDSMKYLLTLLLLPTVTFAKNFVPASFSANFEESFKSVATGKEKKSYGKIDYKYPGQIRYEKTSPDVSSFFSNGKKSWYYVPPFVAAEEGQVTVQNSGKLPLTKFLDSIKDGIDGSKLFTFKYESKSLTLTFKKEMQKEMTIKEVVLHSSKDAKTVTRLAEFESMTLVSEDGKKVVLKFLELKEDISFLGGHFDFKIPPKTKVVNN
jgi:outer membrane lipoprotein carrier protein